MNRFYNLKTAKKLALGFGLCLTLAVIIGAVAISRMSRMNASARSLDEDTIAGITALAKFSAPVRQFRITEYRAVLTQGDAAQRQKDRARLSSLAADAQTALNAYATSVKLPEDQKNYAAVKAQWQQYLSLHDTQLIPALSRHDVRRATDLINRPMRDAFLQLSDSLDGMLAWNSAHGAALSRQASAEYREAYRIVLVLVSAALALGVACGLVINRYMTGTLAEVSARLEKLRGLCITNFAVAIQAMEHGDLTAEIVTGTDSLDIHTKDEFGEMAATFNAMLDQVKGTIGSFRKSQASLRSLVVGLQGSAAQVATASRTLSATSQQVGAATEEISATMQEISQASEQSARGASEIAQGGTAQAASLSQGSSLVKQLSASVHDVAQDSQAATQSAGDATQAAREGAETVGQSVKSMQNIHRTVSESAQVIASLGEASRQIGGIVQTIDEIAEQTNLLALNAAIEAARAGDAGRGFAVVADEVRKLAERSGAATREISGLIGDVQSRTEKAVASMQAGTQEVQNGRALAEQAGEALARIQEVVGQVTSRVEGIRAATEQMTAASDEVSRAITEVAAVVEQSSAAAEEMSASAEQVSASVQTVAGTVAQQSGAVEELVASSESLSEVARSLEAATAQFRVSAAEAPASQPALRLLKAA